MAITINGLGGCPIRLESVKQNSRTAKRIQNLVTKQDTEYNPQNGGADISYQVAPEIREYLAKWVY